MYETILTRTVPWLGIPLTVAGLTLNTSKHVTMQDAVVLSTSIPVANTCPDFAPNTLPPAFTSQANPPISSPEATHSSIEVARAPANFPSNSSLNLFSSLPPAVAPNPYHWDDLEHPLVVGT